MRRWLPAAFLAVVAVLFIASCEVEETEIFPPGEVNYSVTSDGAALVLTWSTVEEAEGYRVYVDNELIFEDTVTVCTVTTVGKEIGVTAYKDELESDMTVIDVAPKTSTVTIYERSSSGYSAMGWNEDGVAIAYSLRDTANYPNFHLYLDDFTPGEIMPSEIYFVAPSYNAIGDPFNTIETGFKALETTQMDSVLIADAIGTGYTTPTTEDPLVVNGVYLVWIDTEPHEQLNDGDHFAKVKILSISDDGAVQLECVYQKVSMLRWLPTP